MAKVTVLKAGGKLSPTKAAEMLKDGTANGKKLTAKQKRYFGMVSHGKAEHGAELKPIGKGTSLFSGPSHDEGGIPFKYGGAKVEVEGGETLQEGIDGADVMGGMRVPGTKKTFANVSKLLATKEQKVKDRMFEGAKLIDAADVTDKWELLKFNTGEAFIRGGIKKLNEIEQNKEHLTAIQRAMLEHSEELGVDPNEFSKGKYVANKGTYLGKAKYGAKLPKAQPGAFMAMQAGAKRSAPSNTSTISSTDPWEEIRMKAEEQIKALHPGKEVRVAIDKTDRNITTQRGLRGSGASKTSVSLHNFDAARDYIIYVDGQVQNNASAYRPIQAIAKSYGFSHVGDWDPGHIGMVQEGRGRTLTDLFNKYPDRKNTEHYKKSYDYLKNLVTSGQADSQEIAAWRQLSGDRTTKYTPAKIDYKKYASKKPLPTFGETSALLPFGVGRVDIPKFGVPANVQKSAKQPTAAQTDYSPTFTNPRDINMPSNAENLELTQILPELYTAATNKEESVWLQQYQPELFEPYQVSFQDRLNEQNAQFNNLQRLVADNPSALSTLAGQQYSANSSVLGEEFRTNQAIANDVTNKNIALLNDAQSTNLKLADNQYVRQSTAKSNTKAQDFNVLDSISNKLLQREADNRALKVYENMYPYYRFDPDSGKAIYGGPSADEWINLPPSQTAGIQPIGKASSVTTMYGPDNKIQRTTVRTPSKYDEALKRMKEVQTMLSVPQVGFSKKKNGGNVVKYFNSHKKAGKNTMDIVPI